MYLDKWLSKDLMRRFLTMHAMYDRKEKTTQKQHAALRQRAKVENFHVRDDALIIMCQRGGSKVDQQTSRTIRGGMDQLNSDS